ncbi:MAG: hypothetical protein BWY94_02438 [Actinobacteria bacterium ADurb.BinA094]|nr:MAG: hypothetical protein BWY94_02438 [Actinobacteria bacterium ADurb.BinA094]
MALSSRAEEKSTARPSGVKLVGRSSAEWKVSRVASPPVAGMTKRSKSPYRSEAKAICVPSGDQTGAVSYAAETVSGVAAPPAAGTRQRSPR